MYRAAVPMIGEVRIRSASVSPMRLDRTHARSNGLLLLAAPRAVPGTLMPGTPPRDMGVFRSRRPRSLAQSGQAMSVARALLRLSVRLQGRAERAGPGLATAPE